MKKINGCVLGLAVKEKSDLDTKEIFYKAFKQLRKLHRNGYAHLDAHPGNIMISPQKPYKATLIDLSKMQPVSYLGLVWDYKTLFEYLPQHCSISDFYLRETKEYFQKHTIAAMSDVINWLLFAAVLTEMFPSLVDPKMGNLLIGSCMIYEMARSANFLRSLAPNILVPPTLGLAGFNIYRTWKHGPSLLLQHPEENVFNPWAWVSTVYMYIGLALATRLITEFLDDYILPEKIITNKMDMFFNHVHPLKENLLSQAENIPGVKRLLPASYAKRIGIFSTQEQYGIDKTIQALECESRLSS